MHGVFEKVKEKDPLGLVCNRRGEALSCDDVPSSTLIHQLIVRVEKLFDFGSDVLVKLVQSIGLIDESDSLLLELDWHIGEPSSVLGDGFYLNAIIFFFTVTHDDWFLN